MPGCMLFELKQPNCKRPEVQREREPACAMTKTPSRGRVVVTCFYKAVSEGIADGSFVLAGWIGATTLQTHGQFDCSGHALAARPLGWAELFTLECHLVYDGN